MITQSNHHSNQQYNPRENPNPILLNISEIRIDLRMFPSVTFIIIMAVLLPAFITPAASQSLMITGRIADAGSPTEYLTGASVVITDTDLGTSTDDAG